MRKIIALLAVVILPLALASCYMPTKYDLKIQILKDGRYAYEYEGDLIHLRFLQKLGTKEVAQGSPEERAQADIYIADLKRDQGFTSIKYVGEARFRVKYRHQGNINERKSYSFVRRNGWFMRILRNQPGVVELQGNKLPKNYRDELIATGFDSWGKIRVWSDAKVEFHNAGFVQEGSPTMYEWIIRSMAEPTPKMVIGIDP